MAIRLKVYVPVGTTEYAKLWGISQRTARRRLAAMPGAVKIGTRWTVPIPATTYARHKGISPTTARRKGIRAATPIDARDVLSHEASKKTKARALATAKRHAHSRPRYRAVGIEERLEHATPRQLSRLANLKADEWDEITADDDWMHSDDWLGDDGYSILYYH